ncbi:MAG: SGNH/GDSL hydrolase family protein [Lachnospiraceae bacterium]|nr:SGNH/GDSL hydrolase family protein [Lachnospiraceae bacterium]
MRKGKAKQTVTFFLASLLLAMLLLTAPGAVLRVQAAPVTFPDGTVFDPEYYAQNNPDVTAAVGTDAVQLWLHYYNFGRAEGRLGAAPGTKPQLPLPAADNAAAQAAQAQTPAPAADNTAAPAAQTAAATPAAAPASVTFDPAFYAARYADVKAAFGTDAAKLWQHYSMFGEKEGRLAAANAVPGVTKITAPKGIQALPAPAAPVIPSNGNRIAFIGDSISTYGGQLPPGYEPFYPAEGLDNLAQTWWYQVAAGKGLQVVVNASYSRSRVAGNRNDPTGFCISSMARINTVAAQQPDIVFIMAGTNDFNAAVYPPIFREYYMSLVTGLRAALPNATIVCSTCIPEYVRWKNAKDITIDAYNQEIRTVAAQTGCVLIDTYACGITNGQMIDGLHPNAEGAAIMAGFIIPRMPQIKKK